TPERCVSISGLADDEARATIEFLYEHSTTAPNTYRHAWSPGDIVMWDNGRVLHRADHAGVTGDRVMHRGMVSGYVGVTPLTARPPAPRLPPGPGCWLRCA